MLLLALFFILGSNNSNLDAFDPYDVSDVFSESNSDEISDTDTQTDEFDIYNEYHSASKSGFVNTGYVFFPFYNKVDDDNTAYGVDAMYYFRRQKEPPYSKPSYLRGVLAVGSDSYASVGASYNSYWKNEASNFYGSTWFERRKARYYQPLSEDPKLLGHYRSSQTNLSVLYRQKLWSRSYVGVKFDFQNNEMYSKDPESNFKIGTNSINGLDGGLISGFGLVLSSLEPGSLFSTLGKFEFEISNMFYLNYFGSDFNFGVHSVDIQDSLFIYGAHVFLLRFYGRFMTGEPPYSSLSSVGDMFRAYSVDKYRDRHFMGGNAEYRMLLISVITLRAFFGLGYHASSFSKFKINNALPCYGAGLSFALNKALGINAGFQYLAGKDSKGILFGVGDNY